MDYKKDNMHQSNNLDKPPAEIPVINNNKFNYVINKPNNELKKIVNKEINNISIIKTEINNNKEIVKSIDGGSKSNGIKIYINGNYKFTKNYEKNLSLKTLNNKLINELKFDFSFRLKDGFVLGKDEETIFTLENILYKDELYLVWDKYNNFLKNFNNYKYNNISKNNNNLKANNEEMLNNKFNKRKNINSKINKRNNSCENYNNSIRVKSNNYINCNYKDYNNINFEDEANRSKLNTLKLNCKKL